MGGQVNIIIGLHSTRGPETRGNHKTLHGLTKTGESGCYTGERKKAALKDCTAQAHTTHSPPLCRFRRFLTLHVISGTPRGSGMASVVDNDNDDELTLHPRCSAVKLYTSRPRAFARRRCVCLTARSFPTSDTLQLRDNSLGVSGQGRYLLRFRG